MKILLLLSFLLIVSFSYAEDPCDCKYYQRWIRAVEMYLTQPDFNPSKRSLRRILYKIRKGTWQGYKC